MAQEDAVRAIAIPDFARYRVEPDEEVRLADLDSADTAGYEREEALEELEELQSRIADLQEKLYAEEERSVLVAVQGIDAAGKDSSVKHAFREANPQGTRVYTFKQPTRDELAHDFLWRYHKATPPDGMIHVFNRSHYEDVIVVRVKDLAPEELWRSRYDSINDFERMLVREGTTLLKLFLHVSREEQLERFRERKERPDKHWKFSLSDVQERRHWDDYQRAYEDALNLTSTEWAPWYAVPSDRKWFRNLVVARLVTATLEALDPRYPEPTEDLRSLRLEELEADKSDSSR
jgi:PPK2 family polyphosphate:nucleotide phosphotransferase